MTEVLEPKTAELTGYTHGEWHLDSAVDSAADGAGVPVHCGTGMALGYPPCQPLLPWDPEESLQAEWACTCGFRMSAVTTEAADPLNAVRLAAARLETVQWELDSAQQMLAEALRKAVRTGAGPGSLREAAGMDDAELRVLL